MVHFLGTGKKSTFFTNSSKRTFEDWLPSIPFMGVIDPT